MDDGSGVGGVERVGDVDGDGEKDFSFQRTPGDAVLQGRAVQKLHDNERLPFVLADFVNRADVWMVQRRCGTGFAAEAFQCLRVVGYVLGQKLQRNEAAKLSVLGLVDDAHSAAPEFLDDAVVRDDLTDELGGCGHWLEW